MDTNNPIVARTAEQFEAIVIRFAPGRGVIADCFPPRIAIRPEMLFAAQSQPGVIQVDGAGGIGTRITFTLANGEALYEVTDRAVQEDTADRLLIAERKAFKFKVAGKEVEAKTYGLEDLNRLADDWPEIVALKAEVFDPPAHLKNAVRVRNRYTAPQVVITLGQCRAIYTPVLAHQHRSGDYVYIAERITLKTPTGQIVRLPAAAAVGRTGFRMFR